jgi:hypothetical protein
MIVGLLPRPRGEEGLAVLGGLGKSSRRGIMKKVELHTASEAKLIA